MKIKILLLILFLNTIKSKATLKKNRLKEIIKDLKIIEKEQKDTENEIREEKEAERKLFFPYFNPLLLNQPIAQTQTTIHNEEEKKTEHHSVTHTNNALLGNPYMQPPIAPFLSLAHLNPYLLQGNFFGFNPYFSQFLRMQYLSMLPFHNPYYNNGSQIEKINYDPDTADMRKLKLDGYKKNI